jgi:hypothetical protein
MQQMLEKEKGFELPALGWAVPEIMLICQDIANGARIQDL